MGVFMIVLNRKRIYIVLTCLVLSTIVFQMSDNSKKVDSLETVALPVNNKTIIIDAGHGRRRSVELLQKMEQLRQI